MNNLSQRLAALMQDDSVPMSDAWGKLFDDLKQADCDLDELLALREAGKEPVAWEVKGILCHTLEEAQLYVGEPEPLYAAPQLPAVPDGWVMVPKEPTDEMNKAGWSAMNEHDAINPTWRAMIAAAPKPEGE